MIVDRITIDINLEPEDLVEGSLMRPMYKPDGSLDDQSVADFDAFVLNVMGLLDVHGFDVENLRMSSVSRTSYYFECFKLNPDETKNRKVVVIIRIADHVRTPPQTPVTGQSIIVVRDYETEIRQIDLVHKMEIGGHCR